MPAADKQWIGKSFEDLERLRHYLRGERAVSDVVRAQAIQAIDAAAQDGKIRRGLLPDTVNAESFDTYEKKMRRYMVTTDRELADSARRDLFANEVQLPPPQPRPGDDVDDDLME